MTYPADYTMDMLWWACEQLERPPDPYVMWHYVDCPTCRFKADIQAQRFPDDGHVKWLIGMMIASR